MKQVSTKEYKEGTLEEKYQRKVNRIISRYEGKKLTLVEENLFQNELAEVFKEYERKVLGTLVEESSNYDVSFDNFVSGIKEKLARNEINQTYHLLLQRYTLKLEELLEKKKYTKMALANLVFERAFKIIDDVRCNILPKSLLASLNDIDFESLESVESLTKKSDIYLLIFPFLSQNQVIKKVSEEESEVEVLSLNAESFKIDKTVFTSYYIPLETLLSDAKFSGRKSVWFKDLYYLYYFKKVNLVLALDNGDLKFLPPEHGFNMSIPVDDEFLDKYKNKDVVTEMILEKFRNKDKEVTRERKK